MGYNGDLVSNLGVKKYLDGYEANKFSNINILQSWLGNHPRAL